MGISEWRRISAGDGLSNGHGLSDGYERDDGYGTGGLSDDALGERLWDGRATGEGSALSFTCNAQRQVFLGLWYIFSLRPNCPS